MKTLRIKAWVLVGAHDQVCWDLSITPPQPFFRMSKEALKVGRSIDDERIQRVDVTITPAKPAAKRGKR